MKTPVRKRSRETRSLPSTAITDLLSQLEQRVYRCVERIHELEQQNTEYELYYEKHKHGIEQNRQQLAKELEQKEQLLHNLRNTLTSKEAQIQDLKLLLRQKEQSLKQLTQENEQLKQELQQTHPILPLPTELPADYEKMERIRTRIQTVLYKLDQLERMVHTPSMMHNKEMTDG